MTLSSDQNRAIMNALNDKCTCHYTDDKDGNPVPSEKCTQCRAAFAIETLEGEVRRVNDLLVDAHQHANKWMKGRDKESARAERLRVALTKAHNDLDISPLTDKEREAVVAEISAVIHEGDK